MSRTSTSALKDGVILNNRYRIVRQIGRGGFGRAYLAEDTQRYREYCVLKEFAPQVESDRELRQAEDLFEREAGILYKLKHSQIPKFEALLRTRIDGRRSLFLVQEYIEGESYWELFRRKGKLSESEVTKMIWEVLPVLDYIHASELIHRDISPDNLIRRELDEKTVLIDFGCVKLAANAVSKSTGRSVTLIGKKGYSPDEQMYRGQATKSSDLYSLAATAVALLTGKQPDELYDSQQGQWKWESQAKVSPEFKKVLNKMLSDKPRDRYQSAERVRQVLSKPENSILTSFISRVRTMIVAPGDYEDTPRSTNFSAGIHSNISRFSDYASRLSRQVTRIPTAADFRRVKPWQWGMITAAIIIIPGLISFAVIRSKLTGTFGWYFGHSAPSTSLSQDEQKLQQDIYQRVEALKLDAGAFYAQVDQTFHEQHPELSGVKLTEVTEHRRYREIWYEIALNLLDKQEKQLN